MSRVKLTKKQAKTLNLDFPKRNSAQRAWNESQDEPPPSARRQDGKGVPDKLFDAACKAHGLPVPVHEYHFKEGRKWAVDFLFDDWLAVEVEGSPWIGKPCPACKQRSGGRHNHGQGFLDDMEKYNELTICGFVLIRILHEQIKDGSAFALIKRTMEAYHEQP